MYSLTIDKVLFRVMKYIHCQGAFRQLADVGGGRSFLRNSF